jgi:hypothetical protein
MNNMSKQMNDIIESIILGNKKDFDEIIMSETLNESMEDIDEVILTITKYKLDWMEEYIKYVYGKFSLRGTRFYFREEILRKLIKILPSEKVLKIIEIAEEYPAIFKPYYKETFNDPKRKNKIYLYEKIAKYHPIIIKKMEVIFKQHAEIFAGLAKGHHFEEAKKLYNKFNNKEKKYVLNIKRLKDYIIKKKDIEIMDFLLSLGELNLEKYIIDNNLMYKNTVEEFFDYLCRSYNEIINKTINMPQVLCEIINDYANNLIYLIKKYDNTDNISRKFIEIILKYNCKDYETIKKYVYSKYPEVLEKYVEISVENKYYEEEFLIKNFGIKSTCNRKKTNDELSERSQSLLRIIRGLYESKIENKISAYSLETLQRCVMKYIKKTIINDVTFTDVYYNNNQVLNINEKMLMYKYSLIILIEELCEKNINMLEPEHYYPIEMLSHGIITKKNWNFLSKEDKNKFLKSYGIKDNDYTNGVKRIIRTEINLISELMIKKFIYQEEFNFMFVMINCDDDDD